MFIDFKFGAMKAQVRAYLNPMQNLVSQLSVADFYFLKLGLTKHVGVNQVLLENSLNFCCKN